MSVKSIGYNRLSGIDKAKQYVMPTITISESGQILDLEQGTPPSNVVVDDSLIDLQKRYNQESQQEIRLQAKYDDLNTSVTDISTEVSTLKTNTDDLLALCQTLNNDMNSTTPSTLVASVQQTSSGILPNYFRIGPMNNDYANNYHQQLGDPIQLTTGFYNYRLNVGLKAKYGTIVVDGVDYMAITSTGAANVYLNVVVYLNDVLYHTFMGCGTDWKMNQLYIQGQIYMNITEPTTCYTYIWFGGNLPYVQDEKSNGNIMSWAIDDNPENTCPYSNPKGWMNNQQYGSSIVEIWKLNED